MTAIVRKLDGKYLDNFRARPISRALTRDHFVEIDLGDSMYRKTGPLWLIAKGLAASVRFISQRSHEPGQVTSARNRSASKCLMATADGSVAQAEPGLSGRPNKRSA